MVVAMIVDVYKRVFYPFLFLRKRGFKIKKQKKSNIEGRIEEIKKVVIPLCKAENFELVYLEHTITFGDDTLRFVLDKEGGISLDDCAYMSSLLKDIIDVSIDKIGAYRLEVSSQGI